MKPSKIDKNDKVISLKGIIKSFEGNKVLNGIDLELHKGENLVVMGRSGSGKSVLIKIIVGLLIPDSGNVNVLGKDLSQVSAQELHELRLRIGFSFQKSALYDSMTVKENLKFPLIRNQRNLSKREINDAIDKVLDDVGLKQTINQMPAELSGGQIKRIGIARTLILHPEIILYDEPTSGLDPVTSSEINDLINEVQRQYNTSSIIITHDLTCAKATGDRVTILLDGQFKKMGDFDEIFKDTDTRIRSFYDYNFITDK